MSSFMIEEILKTKIEFLENAESSDAHLKIEIDSSSCSRQKNSNRFTETDEPKAIPSEETNEWNWKEQSKTFGFEPTTEGTDCSRHSPGGSTPPSSECPRRRSRRVRAVFSSYQIGALESSFKRRQYVGSEDRLRLAKQLDLTESQVKTWFQNRRTKWKRESLMQLEVMAKSETLLRRLSLSLSPHPSMFPWQLRTILQIRQ